MTSAIENVSKYKPLLFIFRDSSVILKIEFKAAILNFVSLNLTSPWYSGALVVPETSIFPERKPSVFLIIPFENFSIAFSSTRLIFKSKFKLAPVSAAA